MPPCIAVKFDNGPKLHYVEMNTHRVPKLGHFCVVNTRRGLEIGLVRTEPKEYSKPNGYFVREASEEDLDTHQTLKERAEELKWFLKSKAKDHTKNFKVIALEFNFDASLLVVSYTSEEQVPLRTMVHDLIPYTDARIEFVNVGPRDQARMLGALGVCGDGTCSSRWLQGFNVVGIRMARDQQLPLNPEKISGPCGRLMCCLQYEHEMYEELLQALPRRGAHACHEENNQCGRVIKLNPLKQTVDLQAEDGSIHEFPASELKVSHRGYQEREDR
jgi:cell fate regulator YaaT (PSP1 superfamily)